MRQCMRMPKSKITQTPEVATGTGKLAVQVETIKTPSLGDLWDVPEFIRHVPVCRRTIHDLRKRGLPHIVLGRRLFFHPASVEAWLLRRQRGGE